VGLTRSLEAATVLRVAAFRASWRALPAAGKGSIVKTTASCFGIALVLGLINYVLAVRPRLRMMEDVLDETGTLESWWALEAAPDPQVPRPTAQPSVGNTSSRKVRTRPSPSPGHSITR